jgi:hypothetical protein
MPQAVGGVGALVDLEADAVCLEGEVLVARHFERRRDREGGCLLGDAIGQVAGVSGGIG